LKAEYAEAAMRNLLLSMVLLSAAACGNNAAGGHADAGPTTGAGCTGAGADPKCGTVCAADVDCGGALYCTAAKKCTADCTGTVSCGTGYTCGAHGHCNATQSGVDAGSGCPRVSVDVAAQVPMVLLLIDQSGSMTSNFNNMTRWNAVKAALVDPTNGVVFKLQSKVKFGVTMYTSHGGTAGGTCPILTPADLAQKPPVLDNAQAVATLLNASKPDGDTPTGESIGAVVPKLVALPHDMESGGDGPRVILLATDGEPDSCAIPNPSNTTQQQQTNKVAVDAAKAAYQQGIGTIILSVGSNVGAAHLQDMANAGAGVATGAKYYVANDPATLASSFDAIIRGVRTCIFKLSGSVETGAEKDGEVKLNGSVLAYNGANGWRLNDPVTLELLGTACTTFKTSDQVTLEATFPCGTITIN
jgi:hypothetical protein